MDYRRTDEERWLLETAEQGRRCRSHHSSGATPVWHCPVCGLNFNFYSELDWHIREAHCLKRTAGLAGQPEREAVLSWALLRELQASQEASVSLLLWTTPAPVMMASDAANLDQLKEVASTHLAREQRGAALVHLQTRLDEAVRSAKVSPTDHGLAVFVSASQTALVPLPFSPQERAVVSHAFATRDLLDALQRFPMYRALLLRGPDFALLEGRGEHLSNVLDWQVPNPSLRKPRQSAWTTRQRRRAAFAAAERAIGERVAVLGRLPLVVMGCQRLIEEFSRCSSHAASIVGKVPTWSSMHSRASAARLAAPVVAAWREQHTSQYLRALAEADGQGQVVWGLGPVWGAVVSREVARLWVERDYRVPGHVTEQGRTLVPTQDTEEQATVADLVDVVIERAALGGAHVEMLESLHRQGGHIAAQLATPLTKTAVPSATRDVPSL